LRTSHLAPLLAVLCWLSWLLPQPAQAQTKILFVGDSLTEGYGVAKEASYPTLVEATLKERGYKDVIAVNAGVSGATTASGVSRLKWHLNGNPKPKIMLLALGANDGLRGLDLKASRKNLVDVIKLGKQHGMQVLLAGMKMPPNYGVDYTTKFAAMFEEIAKEEDVPLLPFLLEGVAADSKLNLADGIHPNPDGYKIVAATVVKYLEPLLAKEKK